MDSVDFDALEVAAQAGMSPGAFAFLQGGADDEITVRENVAAWRALRLRPKVLRDISTVTTATTILGSAVATPIMLAPSGRQKIFHPDGEREAARGAARTGAVYTLSTTASTSLEDVAEVRGAAPQFFQLYLHPDRGWQEALLDRLAAARFGAVMFTVDQPVYGWSPRAARCQVEPTPDIRHVNLPGAPMGRSAYDAAHAGQVIYPATYRDLEWLARRSPVDVVVKGILRGDEARRCLDAGAKGIVVSNHGGRHLDTTVTSCDALPEVVDVVAGRAEIYVDGGIRRGGDVLKALALGARAVLIGRPAIWGLATGGADGVRAVLEHLRTELMRAMALAGVAKPDEATADLVARPEEGLMAVNESNAPGVTGMPKLLLRAEGAALFIGAVALFARLDAFSWVHVLIFIAPDLSFLAYLAGARVGALIYNVAHTTVLPIVLGLLAMLSDNTAWVAIALVWLAHIGFDRLLGYGLKYPAGFGLTHLGPIRRGLG